METRTIMALCLAIFTVGLLSFLVENITSVEFDKSSSTFEDRAVIGNSFDRLIWFLQISDIHLSVERDSSSKADLTSFCCSTLDIIKPAVVLASGDLTDAKTPYNLRSVQYSKEWKWYKGVLEECQVKNKTRWLDIRGNHDSFGVLGVNSSNNYFRSYSMQGSRNPRSYMTQVRKGKETYSFIAVDASLHPGPHFHTNFLGYLDENTLKQLEELQLRAMLESNFTLWFGHYPTSCIMAPNPGLRDLIGHSGLVYFCGHLHKVLKLIPNMYTLQQSGNLELELADWKDNRIFRLAAIDHGLFSFVDVLLGEWPVILPTNPKHALYAMPSKEPLASLINSTHIRVLVFSKSPIKDVSVKVDDDDWRHCKNIAGPLYTVSWDPTMYMSGLHNLQVKAEDADGTHTVTQPFSLDSSRLSFKLLSRFILMTDLSVVFQLLFYGILLYWPLPLIILKIIPLVYSVRAADKKAMICCLKKTWILSTVNKIFWSLIFSTLWVAAGPWWVEQLDESQWSIVFAWGTYIRGSYLPTYFTYAIGCFPITFQLLHASHLARCVEHRFNAFYYQDRSPLSHKAFYVVLILQTVWTVLFLLGYGLFSLVFSPLHTWLVVVNIWLWRQAKVLPKEYLREANLVWGSNESNVKKA